MTFPKSEELLSRLERDYFCPCPITITEEEISKAVEAFINFISLPNHLITPLLYRLNDQDRGSEVGYNNRRRSEGKTDDRDYFHYHSAAEEGFKQERQSIPELDRLLRAMKPIYEQATDSVKAIFRLFDQKFPGTYEKVFDGKRPDNLYLRLVAYKRHNVGDFLAIGHYDRGGCAFALAESAPGLRIGPNPDKLRPVEHVRGEGLFFPGIRFDELTGGNFVPAWHDVIQKEQDDFSSDWTRWALVMFIDHHKMQYVTYEEAHRPVEKNPSP